VVNFTAVASDAQVPRTTVYEYFDILRDTLVLHEVPAWRSSLSRKPLVSSKYYFFDVGVASWLQGRPVRAATPEFGAAFETWIAHELVCHRDYAGGSPVSHWRSASGYEVDFVLGDHTAVEVKAKENVAARDLRSLQALAEERSIRHAVCVTREPRPRRVGQLDLMPYGEFLDALWAGDLGG
jgi:predicted AAA+ superfamily ATPase